MGVISICTPEAAGIGIFANWTAALACEWVRQHFEQEFSESGMRDLFHRVGLSYTRPTYTLKKADKEKQEAFRETFEGLKRALKWGNRHDPFLGRVYDRDYQAII